MQSMTNVQILKHALKKAIYNTSSCESKARSQWHLMVQMSDEMLEEAIQNGEHLKVIFQHDFAEALWGDEMVCSFCGKEACKECPFYDSNNAVAETHAYAYHLQQMILENDQLQYLTQSASITP